MASDDYDDEEYEDDEYVEEVDEVDDFDDRDNGGGDRDHEPHDRDSRGPGLVDRVKALFVTPNARPGEHDVVRSPFVIWLTGGTVVLLLLAFVFWFMMSRETAQRQFDAAKSQMDSGKYAQAIAQLEKFLSIYPKHKLSEPAKMAVGQSKILSHIGGASSDWVKGVEEVQNFITANRDAESFPDYTESLREYADSISLGAAVTAQKSRKQEDLLASKQAQKILERYKGEAGIPKEKMAAILENQELAEAAIRQKDVFESGVADVQTLIKKGDLLGALEQRRLLLQRDTTYLEKPEVAALLTEVLDAEAKTVVVDETARDAETDDIVLPTPLPLSITPQTRSTYTEESDGTLVYAIGADCLYGVDSVTGTPVWRKVIGLNQPFNPVKVGTSVPGLLLFDTNYGELVVRSQADGTLIWRQPIDGALAGAPLVQQNQIYLPTRGNSLYKFNLENGRLSGKLTFNQGLLAPPVASADGDHLVIAGEKSLLYTVSLRPFECKKVMNLGHAAGSIRSPILGLAELFAVCENDEGNSANVRILSGGPDAMNLKQIAAARIEGQVHSPAHARGSTFVVPSNPQTLTIFSVSDAQEQETLTPLATRQLPDVPDAPMYLSLMDAGQIWLFSRSLRLFNMKTESVSLDPKFAASGLATQPIQKIGQRFYLGRNPEYGKSVYFTQTDRQMATSWRVVLGSQVLANTVVDKMLIGINDAGVTFRIGEQQIADGGFAPKPSAPPLDLPKDLTSPTSAIATADGRLVFYVGGRAPAFWLINKLGQLQQKVTLSQPMETQPVAIAKGIVCPLPGKLRLKAAQGRVDDYPMPTELGKDVKWSWLLPLDETHVVAIDSNGGMTKVQFRSSPTAHLKDVSAFKLDSPTLVKPAVGNDKIAVADSNGKLLLLSGSGFDEIGEFDLPSASTNELWIVGDRLFVETGRGHLYCFDISSKLVGLWDIDAPSGVAGAPFVSNGKTIVALQNGEVITVDGDGVVTDQRLSIGQPLRTGPFAIGDKLLTLAIDGSFYRVESLLAGDQ